MTEDLMAVTGGMFYKFSFKNSNFKPFLGAGVGAYIDTLTIDTPATGVKSGSYSQMGFNLSAGMIYHFNSRFDVILPEFRYHMIYYSGSYLVTNYSLQVAIKVKLKKPDETQAILNAESARPARRKRIIRAEDTEEESAGTQEPPVKKKKPAVVEEEEE